MKNAGEVITSHSLLLEQLKKHAAGKDVLREYEALGINLPSDDLLKKVKKSLSGHLHPDRAGGNNELMGKVNGALEVLGNTEKTAGYREILQNADSAMRQNIEKLFRDIAGKQTEFYERTAQRAADAARLKLPFKGKATEQMNASELFSKKIHDGFKNSSRFKRGAIAFALVTGTSLLAYGLASMREKKLDKNKPVSYVDMVSSKNDEQQKSMMV
ncbi:MAG: hypothetical protein R3D71_01140 [Rickettsiales bacterium]